MADRVRVGVLVSGRGSNMLALSEHKRRDPERTYDIVLVASNVPEARGLVLAKRLGIKTWASFLSIAKWIIIGNIVLLLGMAFFLTGGHPTH